MGTERNSKGVAGESVVPKDIKEKLILCGLAKDADNIPDLNNRQQFIAYLETSIRSEKREIKKIKNKPVWHEQINPETGMFPVEEEELNRQQETCSQYMSKEDLEIVYLSSLLAIALHRNQYRLTGHPYPIHTLGVGTEIAEEYQADAVTVTAANLHDTLEDTFLQYYPEILSILFTNEVLTTVKDLSLYKGEKVRPELAEEESRMKIIKSILTNPRVAVTKIYDRLFNMRTLYAIPNQTRKNRTINETENIYIPLADLMGMHNEADELRALCLQYRDPQAWEKIVDKIDEHNNDLINTTGETDQLSQLKALHKILESIFSTSGINMEIKVRPCSFENIYELGKFAVDVDLILKNMHSVEPINWGREAVNVANILHFSNFIQPFDEVSERSARESIINGLTDSLTAPVYYLKNGASVALRTRIIPQDTYQLDEEANLAFLLSVTDTDLPGIYPKQMLKRTKRLSEIKHDNIIKKMDELQQNNKIVEKPAWLLKVLTPRVPYDHILVIGIDSNGQKQYRDIPKKLNSVIAYAKDISSDNWFKASSAKVNGETVDLTHELKEGDEVNIQFDETSNWDPAWVYAFPYNSEPRKTIAKNVKKLLRNNETKDKTLLDILSVGHGRLEKELPVNERPLRVGPGKAIDLIKKIYKKDISEHQFLIDLGLGYVPDEVIKAITPILLEKNRKVKSVKVYFTPNLAGQQHAVDDLVSSMDINMIGIESSTLGENFSIIQLFFDPDDAVSTDILSSIVEQTPSLKKLGLQSVETKN